MKKYNFSRGCLVGNLGQEMAVLPNSFRKIIIGVFNQWQFKTASCLRRAQETGENAFDLDCDAFDLGKKKIKQVLSSGCFLD